MSPLLTELYLDAARKILDRALVEGDQPPMIQWRFEINGGNNSVKDGFKVLHHDSWDKHLNARRAEELERHGLASIASDFKYASKSATAAGDASFSNPSGISDLPFETIVSMLLRSTTSSLASARRSVTLVAVSATSRPLSTFPSCVSTT